MRTLAKGEDLDARAAQEVLQMLERVRTKAWVDRCWHDVRSERCFGGFVCIKW